MKKKPPALIFLLLAPILLYAQAQDAQVTATTSTDTVGVTDQFQLTVKVTSPDSGQAQIPRIPRLQGLSIVAGPSLSTQFQWINGQSTSSRSFIYVLLPEREGQFTIGPIEVTVGSRVYKTEPITIRVTSASRTPAPAPRSVPADPFGMENSGRRAQISGDDIYVTAELDRFVAYPGQQVTLTYHLYTQVNVTGLQLQESPPLTGFWVENLDVAAKPVGTRRAINGKTYLDYVVKKQALFPNAAGKLTIPPSTFAISVKSSGDFFGFFGQTETIYRQTREVGLDVRSLPPQDRPEGFSNAVGSFTLSAELNKSEAAAGEALSLRLRLSGKGNLKEIPDVPLPAMPDLTVYSSKREDSVHPVDGDQIGGEKLWEYVIVPKVPGDHTIPSLSFSFFDAQRERYETVSTTPISLKVTPGSEAENSISGLPGGNRQNLTRQGTDINFIKLSAAELQSRQEPIYRSAWFYVLVLLPVGFNVGAFLYQRERARQSADVVLARSRRARRLALHRLRKAERAGRIEPRRFYDEAAQALAGYLGDHFNLPEIALTADNLEHVMNERAIASGTIKEAVAILQECDFGRFVSASPAGESRSALAGRIRNLTVTLEHTGK